jgi:hypothetical protein
LRRRQLVDCVVISGLPGPAITRRAVMLEVL